MTLESLRDAERVIGVKQVTKAVQKRRTDAVFLAVPTMQELGKACSIEVGAAAAAVLKSDASGR